MENPWSRELSGSKVMEHNNGGELCEMMKGVW